MTSAWGLAGVFAIVVGSVVRELIGLRRSTIRHVAISRLVARARPGTIVHDQDRDGAATSPTRRPPAVNSSDGLTAAVTVRSERYAARQDADSCASTHLVGTPEYKLWHTGSMRGNARVPTDVC